MNKLLLAGMLTVTLGAQPVLAMVDPIDDAVEEVVGENEDARAFGDRIAGVFTKVATEVRDAGLELRDAVVEGGRDLQNMIKGVSDQTTAESAEVADEPEADLVEFEVEVITQVETARAAATVDTEEADAPVVIENEDAPAINEEIPASDSTEQAEEAATVTAKKEEVAVVEATPAANSTEQPEEAGRIRRAYNYVAGVPSMVKNNPYRTAGIVAAVITTVVVAKLAYSKYKASKKATA